MRVTSWGSSCSTKPCGAGRSRPPPARSPPRPSPQRKRQGPSDSVIGGSHGAPSSGQSTAQPSHQPPATAPSVPPASTTTLAHCELVLIGLSVTPPGFPIPDLVWPPPPPPGAAAAARAAAALLRLASTGAARFIQQQLGLQLHGTIVVRRVWRTPGGRLAVHVALPTPLAAQVLARKRFRLRGTPYSVDLPRCLEEHAARKTQREHQHGQQQQQQAAGPPPSTAGFGLAAAGRQATATGGAVFNRRPAPWRPAAAILAVLMVTLTLCFSFLHRAFHPSPFIFSAPFFFPFFPPAPD